MSDNNKTLSCSVFWFRRDLRLKDNKGLYHALTQADNVIPVFIFDANIIDTLPRNDARISFIYHNLQLIQQKLSEYDRKLLVLKGKPLEVFKILSHKYNIETVFANKDHEPYGIQRDKEIEELLHSRGVSFKLFLDHLIFDKNQVLKQDGAPYLVYTPYSKRWKELLKPEDYRQYKSENYLDGLADFELDPFPSLQQIGFNPDKMEFPSSEIDNTIIGNYHKTRDYPAKNGTSRLGIHLRFGTVSLRQLIESALKNNDVYLNELIWREFYAMILWHFPKVVHSSFKEQYDTIPWIKDEEGFEKWKQGKTGYPMVDAGMRELSATGYMHNRVRMITASFLTKHLLIDWRLGEAWFAEKLLDYELSSNNGGWQWSAGSGCDAAPYFRIFNPYEQQKKFDSRGEYIKKWIEEIDTLDYPDPVIEHRYARNRCLKIFKDALST